MEKKEVVYFIDKILRVFKRTKSRLFSLKADRLPYRVFWIVFRMAP